MPYILLKTKSDIFLIPIPLPSSFMLSQISPVYCTLKNGTPAFIYPSAHIRYILHIYKKNEVDKSFIIFAQIYNKK